MIKDLARNFPHDKGLHLEAEGDVAGEPAALKTRAVLDGGEWVTNRRKIWIGTAGCGFHHADALDRPGKRRARWNAVESVPFWPTWECPVSTSPGAFPCSVIATLMKS
ncbi:hypothetical protein [Pseudooceanicola sp.]|uniref:hypothetical protein n=1 Tax=Pseudooceanicola sp. TaxID=1914328 RepID=UPI0026345945|nr:hypothetical protein [Pseudooceanicola sp.]